MSAKVINLAAYRKAKYIRAVVEKMRRGEARFPSDYELLCDLRAYRGAPPLHPGRGVR